MQLWCVVMAYIVMAYIVINPVVLFRAFWMKVSNAAGSIFGDFLGMPTANAEG